MPSEDPDERAQERVGTVLNDKWTLERLIGIGGMAAVYAGLHRNGARAAIKVLHPAYARRKDVRERFLREGYAANRVSHSGVVKVLDDDIIDAGADQGGAFLVMELLEGQSVEDRLEKGPPIGEGELLAILRAVLDVLEVAHKAGVIHRDLKPENLFLARDPENPAAPPRIKILDFGLARMAEGGGRTMAGIAIGTPSYMPPEQASGRIQDVDARSDLFALGASAFRILAHRTVHPAEGAMAICALMARDPAPKLRSVAPNVSEKTADVIDRALEFAREDRFQSAAEMRKAVDDALEALGGEVITIESGMIEVSLAPQERPEKPERSRRSPSPPPVEPKGTSSGWFWWLVVIIAGGVFAKLAWDRFGPKPVDETAEAAATAPPSASSVEEPSPLAEASVLVAVPEAASPEDAALEAPADAQADAGATDAETEAATADGEPTDAQAVPLIHAADAGHVVHHKDAGGRHHHVVHHGTHRR